jgi:hypothetical protein
MGSLWLRPDRQNGERQIVVKPAGSVVHSQAAKERGLLLKVPKRTPMLRCQGFRHDAFLDDHTGSRVSSLITTIPPNHGLPEAPGHEFGDIRGHDHQGTAINSSRGSASSVPLAGEKAEGYRLDKRSPATMRWIE